MGLAGELPDFDINVASPARIWNYWLDGKDHFASDREASEKVLDYDPVVLTHARALLTSTPEGETDYIQADLRDTDTILSEAARTIDFSQPVAILLITILHFIPDDGQAYRIVTKLLNAAAPGSFLVILHAPSDIRSEEVAEMARRYNATASAPITPRTRDQVARVFRRARNDRARPGQLDRVAGDRRCRQRPGRLRGYQEKDAREPAGQKILQRR